MTKRVVIFIDYENMYQCVRNALDNVSGHFLPWALGVVRMASTASVHLEVASWAKRNRISYSSDPNTPWCHRLRKSDFESVKDMKS